MPSSTRPASPRTVGASQQNPDAVDSAELRPSDAGGIGAAFALIGFVAGVLTVIVAVRYLGPFWRG
jgi:hypothetical protein